MPAALPPSFPSGGQEFCFGSTAADGDVGVQLALQLIQLYGSQCLLWSVSSALHSLSRLDVGGPPVHRSRVAGPGGRRQRHRVGALGRLATRRRACRCGVSTAWCPAVGAAPVSAGASTAASYTGHGVLTRQRPWKVPHLRKRKPSLLRVFASAAIVQLCLPGRAPHTGWGRAAGGAAGLLLGRWAGRRAGHPRAAHLRHPPPPPRLAAAGQRRCAGRGTPACGSTCLLIRLAPLPQCLPP